MIEQRYLFGNTLQEYYVKKLRTLNRERSARINELKTAGDAQRYIEEIRTSIAVCFNLPERSGVPDAEVVKCVKKDGYRIENIIIYSRPDFPVTANLYLPETSGKVPCVLFLCGHSQDGKASDIYSCACQNLVLQGYAVLIIDPVSQGERLQFLDVPPSDVQIIGGRCTSEHNMVGKQLALTGEFFGTWRAFDAIRALDYLLSRSEVDTTRVGITGNSGGGTMTSFVQALDPRFTMAAPSCYITSWQRNIENELPADIEQIPPGILGAGCEMGDLILAYAPRPVLLLGQKNDFFDPRGLMETYEEVKKVYTLLGYPDNIQCFIGPTNHGYSVENRNAMYDFFKIHSGITADAAELDSIPVVTTEELLCTATGQVHTSLAGAKTVNALALEKARSLAEDRKERFPIDLKSELRSRLALPEVISEPYCRVLRPWVKMDGDKLELVYSRFGIESEENILTTLKIRGEDVFNHFPAAKKVTLYIPHTDGGTEGAALTVADDEMLVVLDVRGTGESAPLGCDLSQNNRHYTAPYGSLYHYSSCGLLFGEIMCGRQVLDILSAVKFMKARGVENISILGRGNGAIPAAIAGLLCKDICAVTLNDAPASFISMIENRFTWWPESVLIPGILRIAELQDIYDEIAREKKFKVNNFVNDPTEICD